MTEKLFTGNLSKKQNETSHTGIVKLTNKSWLKQNMHGQADKLIGDCVVHILLHLQACTMYSDFYICGNEFFLFE